MGDVVGKRFGDKPRGIRAPLLHLLDDGEGPQHVGSLGVLLRAALLKAPEPPRLAHDVARDNRDAVAPHTAEGVGEHLAGARDERQRAELRHDIARDERIARDAPAVDDARLRIHMGGEREQLRRPRNRRAAR